MPNEDRRGTQFNMKTSFKASLFNPVKMVIAKEYITPLFVTGSLFVISLSLSLSLSPGLLSSVSNNVGHFRIVFVFLEQDMALEK